jgi:phosphoglycolate phosphatase-like HAD superfamily hydrolase
VPDRATPPAAPRARLVPDGISACVFDVDGALTQKANVHAAAWKAMFDEFPRERARQCRQHLQPFELPGDFGVDRVRHADARRAKGSDTAGADPSELLAAG